MNQVGRNRSKRGLPTAGAAFGGASHGRLVQAAVDASRWFGAHRRGARMVFGGVLVAAGAVFAAVQAYGRRDVEAAELYAAGCRALDGRVTPAAPVAAAGQPQDAAATGQGHATDGHVDQGGHDGAEDDDGGEGEGNGDAEIDADRPTFASDAEQWSAARAFFARAQARRGSAGIGVLAGLMVADLDARLRDADVSQKHFDAVRQQLGQDDRLFFLALERYAYLCEAKGDLDGALGALAPLAAAPHRFYADRATLHRARLFEAKGDVDGAVAALTALEQNFPRTALREEASWRLAALRGPGANGAP